MATTVRYEPTSNGIYIPDYVRPKRQRPTAFSFFSGCGGFDLGFVQAGFEVVGANEFDAAASLTYMVNLGSYPIRIHYIDGPDGKDRLDKACERYIFGNKKRKLPKEMDTPFGLYNQLGSGFSGSGFIKHRPDLAPVRNFWFGDVRKLKGKDILNALGMKEGELDCVMGGPPCQGFSQAGRQLIADPRNNLVYEFGRLIVELQPKTFVMEEVPAILDFFDPDGVPVLDKFTMMLADGGFGKWEAIKKGMLMQSGCAAGLKQGRGSTSIKKSKVKSKKSKPVIHEELALF